MMKKNIIYLIALVCTIGWWSCTAERMGDSLSEIGLPVSFTIRLDEVKEHSRAISDGTSIDQLVYALYTDDGIQVVTKAVKNDAQAICSENGLNFTISLPKGGGYKLVCWAQYSECTAYSVSDDMKVTVDYQGANNDELRDAFFGVSDVFDAGEKGVSVVLKRPFAQVNAAAFPFDWEYAKDFHKFDVTQSSAIVRGLANELDLLDGSVSGKVDAYFDPAAIPSDPMMLLVDVDENGKDEQYVYVSMSYVLADVKETMHNVDFYFFNEEGKSVKFNQYGNDVVGIERNKQTNIVGQVLTSSGELIKCDYQNVEEVFYNVTENTTYEDQIYVLDGIYNDAVFGSESGQTVTMNNVTLTGEIRVIELGGYRGASYVNYNNVLNNVVLDHVNVSAAIECHEWYFSPAIIAYGNTTLNNCIMTGTTTTRTTVADENAITPSYIPVDLGVRNESDAVINGGTYGTIFAWTHAVVNINGARVGKLYCGTCDSTKHSWMTIGAGTEIDEVICCEPRCPYGTKEYSTTMTIKKGAKVGMLQLVSTDVEFLIIEDGAKVDKIVCEGVEYTYQELREAMGLS